jgi:excinuclease ABC subunit C
LVASTISVVGAGFQFEHRVAFEPGRADEILRAVPAGRGVFCLRGERESDEPYLTRAADMRRRLRRLLAPPEAVDEQGRPVLSKRLNLRERVRWIEWTATGSEFESTLVLYCAVRAAFGAEDARHRLRLYPPYFVRVRLSHEHPRVHTTNRLSRKGMAELFGPFPSRAAAERYCDAVLDLFKLRRCHEDLQVHPEHPGCAYGEMKKCLAPCKQACTEQEYASEARRVHAFFATRGESMLSEVSAQREAASEAMDFEAAAALHKQWERVKAAAALADELVRPVAELRAAVVQEDAPGPDESGKLDEAAVFLLERGRIVGPERLSTLGVRAVREQTAVGSSLFAQPLMLAAVPEVQGSGPRFQGPEGELAGERVSEVASQQVSQSETGGAAVLSPEDRARGVLDRLEAEVRIAPPVDVAEQADYLSLFRRWYYRPEKQRAGEVFLPNADGSWPVRRLLNGAARVVLGPPAQLDAVDREAARAALKDVKTKVIHAGREGVERVVPVLPKRSRSRKAVTPADVLE